MPVFQLPTLDQHLSQWKGCTKCTYSKTRRKIVLGKGDIPCDILLMGEAPGTSENMLGVPFIGKAGKILDRIINSVFGPQGQRKYRIAYNNVIACIPIADGHASDDSLELREKEEPDTECILACKPRIEQFIAIAKPRLIVAIGKLADEWLDQSYKQAIRIGKVPTCTIQHPASILRMPLPGQSMAEHRCGVIIQSAVNEYLEGI